MIELALIVTAGVVYRRGLRDLWALPAGRRTVPAWRAWSFACGLVVAAVALSPQADTLAHEMFSAHMTQHVALILLGAPLLASGAPQMVLPRALRSTSRRLTSPLRRRLPGLNVPDEFPAVLALGAAAHLLALWTWHAPALYEAALSNRVVHVAEHVAFVGTAGVFWTALLRPGRRARVKSGVGVLCIWVLLAQGGVLAALIVFAAEPLYATYTGVSRWGLDALADQQMAGMIMWMPAGLVYGSAGIATFILWFRAVDDRASDRDGVGRPPIVRAPERRDAGVPR